MNDIITPPIVKNCCSIELIHRVLERTHPFYCNMSEDVFWSSVLFSSAVSFGVIDRMFYHYVQGVGMSTQAHTSPAALTRNMKSILDMSRELYAYMGSWCPKYEEKAHDRIRVAMRHVVTTAVFPETDFLAIAELLRCLDQADTRDLYEKACRELLPLTARRMWGVTNEVMQRLGLECPPLAWFS